MNRSIACLTALLGAALGAASSVSAQTAPPSPDAPPGWAHAYDYMVQDVCTDDGGRVIANISPADTPARCPHRRDVRIGEPLPYHKQDWPPTQQLQQAPFGHQRADSFPIHTEMFGTVVAQARGMGAIDPATRRFVAAPSGGGLYFFSERYVASGFTDDVVHGPQFFLGPRCASSNERERHLDAWIFVARDFSEDRPGETIAHQTGRMQGCLNGRFANSYTDWHVEPLTLRTRTADGVQPHAFQVLISNHFGGPTIETAKNLERFYFTREFGLARWERWQNLDLQQRPNDVSRAQVLATSGRCDPVQHVPSTSGHWVMVDCRQWTNISPADNPTGDPPTAWIDKLKAMPDVSPLLK